MRSGKSKIDTQLWGPSGSPVWNTPTVDLKRPPPANRARTGALYSPFRRLLFALSARTLPVNRHNSLWQLTGDGTTHRPEPRIPRATPSLIKSDEA